MPDSSIEFHDEAAAEYDAAFDWYLERGADTAQSFDAEVDRQAPGRWAHGTFNTRRFLLRRFPFVVIYRERGATGIQTVAFAHCSRRPGYWKQRL